MSTTIPNPAQVGAAAAGAAAATDASPLTLAIVEEVLETIEREEGLVNARRFAAALDYDRLVALAREGAASASPSGENDANRIDPRYLTLWGMRGPHVLDFQEALVSLGYPAPRTGLYDDDTYAAYGAWLRKVGRAGRGRRP